MKKVVFDNSWPTSWKSCYDHDLLEIYGDSRIRGYSYHYANRFKHTLELVKKTVQPGAKILDLAAAQGNFSLSLAELGYEVTWNDFREELIEYVKLKYESGTVHFLPGNIFELNLDSQFDFVLLGEVIEHVAHPDQFLKTVAKLVKPSGYIVMTTPNGEYFRNNLPKFSDCSDPSQFEALQFKPDADGHIFLLHLEEVKSLASQAGLNLVETQLFNNPLTRGALKLEIILKLIPYSWVNFFEDFTQSLPFFLSKKLHINMAFLLTRLDRK
jgi:2-polyprenyl-3-methyl-5-hydroxy-6-metoxy-1,4-benzoquinol methylase